jgi:alpha-glucosidase (family GH31 glycosyl hydrolase)
VDAFWLDIPATEGNRYFTFNQDEFPEWGVKEMNRAMRD